MRRIVLLIASATALTSCADPSPPQTPNMQDRIEQMRQLGKAQSEQARQTAQQQTDKSVPLSPPGIGGTLEDYASFMASAQVSSEQKKAYSDRIAEAAAARIEFEAARRRRLDETKKNKK